MSVVALDPAALCPLGDVKQEPFTEVWTARCGCGTRRSEAPSKNECESALRAMEHYPTPDGTEPCTDPTQEMF